MHHGAHQLGEVGRPRREVGVPEHLDARPEVGDDNGGRRPDPQPEDVAVLLPEGEEAVEQVVGEVVDGADQREVGGAGGEVTGQSPLPEAVDNKEQDGGG